MKQLNITFIGGGNMCEALVSGLINAGHHGSQITVSDVSVPRLKTLASAYKVNTTNDNIAAVKEADVIVLAVKPQTMHDVLAHMGTSIPEDATVVSIAAGVGIDKMKQAAKRPNLNFVRVMPNTPALLGAGMSVLFSQASQEHQDRAEYILAASGATAWVNEERLLHAVTAVSGSGPAYFFLLAETLTAAGVTLGLPKALAVQLANQTAMGAGRMLAESGREASVLRSQVTSPGGTTQAAIDMMYECDLPLAVRKAVQAAAKRSKELG